MSGAIQAIVDRRQRKCAGFTDLTFLGYYSVMAKYEQVAFIDDLDGTNLTPDQVRTVVWTWCGVEYVLDVSGENLGRIEGGEVPLATVLKASARIRGRRRAGVSGSQSKVRIRVPRQRHDVARIRQWAAANGYDVSPRGRLSNQIIEAYEAAR